MTVMYCICGHQFDTADLETTHKHDCDPDRRNVTARQQHLLDNGIHNAADVERVLQSYETNEVVMHRIASALNANVPIQQRTYRVIGNTVIQAIRGNQG